MKEKYVAATIAIYKRGVLQRAQNEVQKENEGLAVHNNWERRQTIKKGRFLNMQRRQCTPNREELIDLRELNSVSIYDTPGNSGYKNDASRRTAIMNAPRYHFRTPLPDCNRTKNTP